MDPVMIGRTWSDSEAELLRGLLESYGIPCQIISDIPHAVIPLSVDGLGEIRLFVPREAAEEAERIIEDHRRAGEGPIGVPSPPPEDAGADGE
jgi:hypothetical protein